MAAVVTERLGSRRTSGRQSQREYFITKATSDDEARTAMLGVCPSTVSVGGVNFVIDVEQAEVEEIFTTSTDGSEISTGIYAGSATWINPQFSIPTGSFQLSFDISGQNVRITQSLRTVGAYAKADEGDPSDFKGAINVQDDDTVEGTDIIVPYFNYTLTKTFSNETIEDGWVLDAAKIVGSVNSAEYNGFQAGELLLHRVAGQQRRDSDEADWDITFSFAVSFNESSLAIGATETSPGIITGISKDGWDYLWVYYEARKDDATDRFHKVPIYAYVERVYRRTDYSTLAI